MNTDDGTSPPGLGAPQGAVRVPGDRMGLRDLVTGVGALALLVVATAATSTLARPGETVAAAAGLAAEATLAAVTVLAAPPEPTLAPVRVLAAPPPPAAPAATGLRRPIAELASRAAASRPLNRAATAAADPQAEPIEQVLRRYSRDRALVRRIAAAVQRESRRAKLEPSLVVAVLVAENNTLRPAARNAHSRATGLMQVMPAWAGRLGCGSTDLADVDANICHGVRVLAAHLREAGGDPREGLRLYNGCRAPGTPRCDAYPTRVLAHAERLEGQLATYARRQGGEAAAVADSTGR